MAQILLEEKIPFSVAHCNFQYVTQPVLLMKNLLELGVSSIKSHFIKRFDTLSFKKEHKQSTQLAARTLRYQWFEERNAHGFNYSLRHITSMISLKLFLCMQHEAQVSRVC